MTMPPELFMSILSMDSFNRGYDAGIVGLGESGQIGNATIVTRADSGISNEQYLDWQSAGFYASAYTLTAPMENLSAGPSSSPIAAPTITPS